MIMTMADGSSPHARGTPTFQFQRHNKARFIPACAGNAMVRRTSPAMIAVHPRMRGERLGMLHVCVFKTGSSPHARGTQVSNHPTMDPKRFIPACAGNA